MLNKEQPAQMCDATKASLQHGNQVHKNKKHYS